MAKNKKVKRDYKRAYFELLAEVERLKEARLLDVFEIARANGHRGKPGYNDWGEYAANMPFRTGSQLRMLIGRARHIERELTDDGEAGE